MIGVLKKMSGTECDKASHKSTPSSVPWGIVDSYSALPWQAITVVEGIT
jgi:hypothetical protein